MNKTDGRPKIEQFSTYDLFFHKLVTMKGTDTLLSQTYFWNIIPLKTVFGLPIQSNIVVVFSVSRDQSKSYRVK